MAKKKKNNKNTLPANDAAERELKPLSENVEKAVEEIVETITPDPNEEVTDLSKLVNYKYLEEFKGANKIINTEEALKLIKAYDKTHLKEYKYVGDTYLMLAVKNHLNQVVEALIPFSDINYRSDISGKTALHLAAHKNYSELYKFLEENGADATITDRSGRTPKACIKENVSNIGRCKFYEYYAQAEAIENMAKAILTPEEIKEYKEKDEYLAYISEQHLSQPSLGKEELPDITCDKNKLNPLSEAIQLSGEVDSEII
jgi:hypothetical protein